MLGFWGTDYMPHTSSAESKTMGSAVAGGTTDRPVSTRLVSLDVLRGITVAFMILVNNNGDGERAYWALKHAVWNGFTPTDLVFPSFLFLMGTSIVLAFDAQLRRGAEKSTLILHTLRRAVILFLFGLVVNGFPLFNLHTLRIYGVLQRIAICYLVCSLLYLWDRRAASKVVLLVVALLGYWILMRWVPVPGFGLPGRDVPLLDLNGNLVAWMDRHLLPGRLYEGVRDPEGFLSTLPALGTTLLGMLTGMWLRTERALKQKAIGLLAAGLVSIALGLLWNHWFPINKKLWTSSYVLFAAGWTLLGFALCYWAVEIKGWKRGWTYFWLVFGTNAIASYMLSELLASTLGALGLKDRLYHNVFAPTAAFTSLLYSICFVLVCWVPMALLYRKRIFIKI
jgi:predicted acyltransferase